jgi:transposase
MSSVGVDGPQRHQACQNEVAADLRQRGPSVEQISRIGMDTSKHIFQLHGVNTAEEPVLRKKLRRKEMFAFLEQLAPTVIAIEACGASHHCARLLQSYGHSVKLIAPQLVQAVPQARQERCGGRRSAVRGDEPADNALRAREDG